MYYKGRNNYFFFSISQLSLIKNATLCWIERFKINLLLFHVNPCGPIGKNHAFEKKQDSLGLHDKEKVSLQTINIIAPCTTALNLCCLDIDSRTVTTAKIIVYLCILAGQYQ